MEKFLLRFSLVISTFAVALALADNPTSAKSARVAEDAPTAVSASAPTPTPGCTDGPWTDTSITNAPTEREYHTAVWTGSEMIVWGGDNGSSSNNLTLAGGTALGQTAG